MAESPQRLLVPHRMCTSSGLRWKAPLQRAKSLYPTGNALQAAFASILCQRAPQYHEWPS